MRDPCAATKTQHCQISNNNDKLWQKAGGAPVWLRLRDPSFTAMLTHTPFPRPPGGSLKSGVVPLLTVLSPLYELHECLLTVPWETGTPSPPPLWREGSHRFSEGCGLSDYPPPLTLRLCDPDPDSRVATSKGAPSIWTHVPEPALPAASQSVNCVYSWWWSGQTRIPCVPAWARVGLRQQPRVMSPDFWAGH